MSVFDMFRNEEPMNDGIFKFDEKNMVISDKQNGKGKKVVCGLIYADWCGHCRMLKPEWAKMYNSINGKLDSHYNEPIFAPFKDSDKDLLHKFNEKNAQYLAKKKIKYSAFPTLFKIAKGKITYYDGKREAEAMEKWYMAENGNIIKNPANTKRRRRGSKSTQHKTMTKYDPMMKMMPRRNTYRNMRPHVRISPPIRMK